MSIIVKQSQFMFSHGKKPRGRGRWCFKIKDVDTFFPADGSGEGPITYTEAKIRACREATKQGAYEIELMP